MNLSRKAASQGSKGLEQDPAQVVCKAATCFINTFMPFHLGKLATLFHTTATDVFSLQRRCKAGVTLEPSISRRRQKYW